MKEVEDYLITTTKIIVTTSYVSSYHNPDKHDYDNDNDESMEQWPPESLQAGTVERKSTADENIEDNPERLSRI